VVDRSAKSDQLTADHSVWEVAYGEKEKIRLAALHVREMAFYKECGNPGARWLPEIWNQRTR
jgi:hypothetical protein